MSGQRSFQSPLLPNIPLDADAGYWSGDVSCGDETLRLSVYVDAKLSDAALLAAGDLLGTLPALRGRGLESIRDQALGPTVGYFFEFHCDEVPDAVPADRSVEALVSALELVGIGVHDDDAPFSIVLDFSFGREHSDELLAVRFGSDGQVRSVSHES